MMGVQDTTIFCVILIFYVIFSVWLFPRKTFGSLLENEKALFLVKNKLDFYGLLKKVYFEAQINLVGSGGIEKMSEWPGWLGVARRALDEITGNSPFIYVPFFSSTHSLILFSLPIDHI